MRRGPRAPTSGRSEIGADADPRTLRLLPRLCRLPGGGRRPRRGGAGGALHTQEARCRLSQERRALLPRRGKLRARRRTAGNRRGRLLRQADSQVPSPARELLFGGAARPVAVPAGGPALAQGPALGRAGDRGRAARPGTRRTSASPVRRAPRVARRERLLSLAVRRGRDSHARRRRRVVDDDGRHRRGRPCAPDRGDALPALARACSTRRSPTSPASASTRASTS
jgi:hypothetical protein